MVEGPDDSLIVALTDRALYDHPTGDLSVIETHISWIVLTGPFAYKIKKPVDLGFVDFSTLARRRFFCEEEVRLNARLAPWLYLGVVPIYRIKTGLSFYRNGPPVEYAVKMVEFDQNKLLSRMLDKGSLHKAHIDRLCARVRDFHSLAARLDASSPYASPERLERLARETFDEVLPVLEERDSIAHARHIMDWLVQEAADQGSDVSVRKREGFVRECHGDMHLANMFMDEDEPVIFDGIEFSEELRWTDVCGDVAFVVMDLEDRDRPDFAHRFLNGYLEATGDYGMLSVLRFYLTYRAMVRARIAAIRLRQIPPEDPASADKLAELKGYLGLAERYTVRQSPKLFITRGVSGSGKSYGTQELVDETGVIRLRSDVERKRLFGLTPLERSPDYPDLDLYAPEVTERVYGHLAQLASTMLGAGYSVVVDATFLKQRHRALFASVARECDVPFAILDFHAEPEILRDRVLRRAEQHGDPSEADLAVLSRQLEEMEDLAEDERPITAAIGR